MNRLRLEYATEGFLNAMRREQQKQSPADPVPIRSLHEYSPAHRSALMRAVGAAIKLTRPENDNAFEEWSEKRSVNET
ncbi:hypothetical protein [Mesorhizobium sp.]|uniref:hypothetical protein n=1 Tax=Mesorhizobium sp. TaxID=1871066 RepID=UPI000FE30833|nr:hypothetical protein [Mesorhizobium sp.]RWB95597.1 MAG: hypothetical protein EOQ56_28020 [Mesorhizobium sp.]RWI35524.1 MAG: hypothetical protein EOR14_28900 [Mesorhizobium sp.]RWJ03460.1 MAG: hypothetical protein EOR24_32280 [Mesorhizobium sp.]RWJ66307.1 MAG: hypothetical protein EOR34_28235 [Mesorhizobium sp.]